MLRGGEFVSFFGQRGQSFALKSCAGPGILTEKIVAWGGWQLVKLIPDVYLQQSRSARNVE